MRRVLILALVLIAAAGGFAWWWFGHASERSGPLTLFGNVDLRQVDLAFNDAGRLAEVLVEEGNKVKAGEVLARLDTSRIVPQVDQAAAQVAAQSAALDKLRNGARPEELAQGRAQVAAAKATADNARVTYERLSRLSETAGGAPAVTQSQIDAAKAAADSAAAQQTVAEQALVLLEAGARKEEIAQAEALLDAARAQLALLQQQKKDTELVAPSDGVIRSRLMEPGEMTSSQRPVFSIAMISPKWVRAYVSGPDLPRIRPGLAATVTVDGVDHPLNGHVGFISSVAEFTPRAIQTEELRTSLVYEVRILVDDPDDLLRLGMPATVRFVEAPAGS
jgi:HlyD family secretion protein